MLSMLMKGCFWLLSRSRSPFRSQTLVRALLPRVVQRGPRRVPIRSFSLGPSGSHFGSWMLSKATSKNKI